MVLWVTGPPGLVVAEVTTDQDGRCCHYSYHRFGEVFSSRVYMMSSALHCTALHSSALTTSSDWVRPVRPEQVVRALHEILK